MLMYFVDYGVCIGARRCRGKTPPHGLSMENYSEELVRRALDAADVTDFDNDEVEDAVCLASNQLPAKYYRQQMDLLWHMGDAELESLKRSATDAVRASIVRIRNSREERKKRALKTG